MANTLSVIFNPHKDSLGGKSFNVPCFMRMRKPNFLEVKGFAHTVAAKLEFKVRMVCL